VHLSRTAESGTGEKGLLCFSESNLGGAFLGCRPWNFVLNI
jgi:hypothetical protein